MVIPHVNLKILCNKSDSYGVACTVEYRFFYASTVTGCILALPPRSRVSTVCEERLIKMPEHPALPKVRIREGKEKQLIRRHPWVFSGAIDGKKGTLFPAEPAVVKVETSAGEFIAYGWYDPQSHIPIHLMSWDQQIFPDISWWVQTISAAVQRRFVLFAQPHVTAFRLIHGEADFLPGLTVDRYGSMLVCIISARVAWDHRIVVVQTLQRLVNPACIVVSTDEAFCGIEHLKVQSEWYIGGECVDRPADPALQEAIFLEHGIAYTIHLGEGQKSGFYCDQRENRLRLAQYVSGKQVLDAFSYTGGFSLHALVAGAQHVTALDSSASALETLGKQLTLNIERGIIPPESKNRISLIKGDVFAYLREMESEIYDCIVLDPPKLAQTKGQVEGALRAYKDLNRLAMLKIRKGGVIATFSCSGGVSREQLRTVLAWAAKDAGREVQILETLGQPVDHPIRLSFPESEYLKGFIFTVL